MKKTLAMVLAVLMIIGLSACGSFESAMVKAAKEMEKVESAHTDMTMDMTMGVSAGGSSADMNMKISMSVDSINEPMQSKAETTTEFLGMSIPMQLYIEQEGETYNIYASTDSGLTWQVQAGVTKAEVSQYEFIDSVGFYLECADTFEKAGEEDVNGAKATRYDGVISGDNVKKALEMSGSAEQISALLGEEGEIGDVGELPLSIWLDKKSGLPVRYDMDMTAVMQSMVSSMPMEEGMTMEISSVTFSVTMSNFNGVSEIVIPDEAKSA